MPDVHRFLAAHPAIALVLEEMATPLRTCFGQHTAVLDVLTDGEEGDFLRLTVHLPHTNTRDAAAALACFDQTCGARTATAQTGCSWSTTRLPDFFG